MYGDQGRRGRVNGGKREVSELWGAIHDHNIVIVRNG